MVICGTVNSLIRQVEQLNSSSATAFSQFVNVTAGVVITHQKCKFAHFIVHFLHSNRSHTQSLCRHLRGNRLFFLLLTVCLMHVRKTGVLSCLISLSGTDYCVISLQSSVVLLERQRLECPPLISVQFALVQIVLITISIYAKIKDFSLCVCVSECSDARQTDLQG